MDGSVRTEPAKPGPSAKTRPASGSPPVSGSSGSAPEKCPAATSTVQRTGLSTSSPFRSRTRATTRPVTSTNPRSATVTVADAPGPGRVAVVEPALRSADTVSRLGRRRLDPPRAGRHVLEEEGPVAAAPRPGHEPQSGGPRPRSRRERPRAAGRPGRRRCRERFPRLVSAKSRSAEAVAPSRTVAEVETLRPEDGRSAQDARRPDRHVVDPVRAVGGARRPQAAVRHPDGSTRHGRRDAPERPPDDSAHGPEPGRHDLDDERHVVDAVRKERERLHEDGLARDPVEDLETDGARGSRLEQEGAVLRSLPRAEVLARLAVARDPGARDGCAGAAHDAAREPGPRACREDERHVGRGPGGVEARRGPRRLPRARLLGLELKRPHGNRREDERPVGRAELRAPVRVDRGAATDDGSRDASPRPVDDDAAHGPPPEQRDVDVDEVAVLADRAGGPAPGARRPDRSRRGGRACRPAGARSRRRRSRGRRCASSPSSPRSSVRRGRPSPPRRDGPRRPAAALRRVRGRAPRSRPPPRRGGG